MECRAEKRLTTAARLIYYTLLNEWNRSYWAETFSVTDSELMALTQLSKPSVIDAKQRLKSLGYIDFYGKPTTYELKSKFYHEATERLTSELTKPQKKCALLPSEPPNHSRRKSKLTNTPTACASEESRPQWLIDWLEGK